MSFITNVNSLAAYFKVLEHAVKVFDDDALKVLKAVPADAFNILAQDIAKGTFIGKRKLDIDLVQNAANPPNEVAYVSADIQLSSGFVVSFNFNISTATATRGATDWITESLSYQNLRDELNKGINDNNAVNAGDPDKEVRDTYIDIFGETDPNAPKRCLRVLDTNGGLSNVIAIQLHVNTASTKDAKDPDPIYSWVDTTSSLKLLIDHLPQFIQHTEIWQKVMSTNPLPTTGTGFLAKTATAIEWQMGAFFKDLGSVDITQDFAANGISVADIHLGSFALVGTGGIPDPEWGTDAVIRTGAILLGDPSGKFRILDDVFHAKAVVDTSKHAPETQGLLAYDKSTQRLAISLPTNVPNTYAWVDASPSLSAGDLSAILAPDGAITTGALNTQAATPKQINEYVTTYAGKKADVDALLTGVAKLQHDFATIPTASNLNTMQANIVALQTDVGVVKSTYLPLTGGTLTGSILLSKAPTADMEPVNLKYASDTFIPLSGGILGGHLQDTADPVANNDLARKQYIDNAIANINSAVVMKDGSVDLTAELKGPAAPPSVDEALANKKYVDDQDALKLDVTGGTVTGDIDMSAKKVTNLPLPTNSSDAATKDYVDTEIPKIIQFEASEVDALTNSRTTTNVLHVWGV